MTGSACPGFAARVFFPLLLVLASCAGATSTIRTGVVPALTGQDAAAGTVQSEQSTPVSSHKGIHRTGDRWTLSFSWVEGKATLLGMRLLMIDFVRIREGKLEGVEVSLSNPIQGISGDLSADRMQVTIDPDGSRMRLVGNGKLTGANRGGALGDALGFDVIALVPPELRAR